MNGPNQDAPLASGERFNVHFVWKLPDGDFARAVFVAEVESIVEIGSRYQVRLVELLGGRQEAGDSDALRPTADYDRHHWTLITRLAGQQCTLPFEAADGRPLYLRLPTLTGEHDFFYRF